MAVLHSVEDARPADPEGSAVRKIQADTTYLTAYINGRATAWGVFKAYVISVLNILPNI